MRKGILGSAFLFLAGTSMALAQDSPQVSLPAASESTSAEAKPDNPQPIAISGNLEDRQVSGLNSETAVRFWASAEYLLWWTKGSSSPPLATTGTTASGGAVGAPGTTILSGGGTDYGARSGGRFTVGAWLNGNCNIGFELGYLFLGNGSNNYDAGSSGAVGSPVLSRPFFNVITGKQDFEVVALPGVAGGGVRISSNSNLQGINADFTFNLCCSPVCPPIDCCQTDCCPTSCCNTIGYRVDLIAGPLWLQLHEPLSIAEQLTDSAGTMFTVVDRFETRNNFYGGQIGARAEFQQGRFFVNVLGKIGIGDTHQEVRIDGSTVISQPGMPPIAQQGGLLAQPTNIGNYSRDAFSVVPEIGFNVGYQLTNHIRIFAGYTFLYWSNVARPGDQIDYGVNPSQLVSAAGAGALVGPARPSFVFHESDFWAQGVNLGLEFRW